MKPVLFLFALVFALVALAFVNTRGGDRAVSGTLDDDELEQAISLIRSSPAPAPREDATNRAPVNVIFRQVRGDWPVLWIRRAEDMSLSVYLLDEDRDERSGQLVTLVREDGAWQVSRLRAFDLD